MISHQNINIVLTIFDEFFFFDIVNIEVFTQKGGSFMFKSYFFLFFLFTSSVFSQEIVNLYTSRHYDSDIELYEKFEEKTGIKVNYVSGKGKALIQRIKSEGSNCPADIFITVDAGNLWKIQKDNLFQKIKSNKIKKILDSKYVDSNGNWIGLAKRYRVIVYNPEKIDTFRMSKINYEDLASDEFKNRIVIRSSSNIYNQSLLSSLIYHNGENYTKKWLLNFVGNFARKPQGNDRAQIMAVANGEADIAIVNHYYIGIMLSGKAGQKQRESALKVKVAFPNQQNRGTMVNVSGGGILKNSPNYKNAIKFLEFLLEEESQRHIVSNTYEYPIIDDLDPSPIIKKLGSNIVEDSLPVEVLGEMNPKAVKMMDVAGWR